MILCANLLAQQDLRAKAESHADAKKHVEQLTANARAFCEAIAAAGYAPMLYGNQRDLLRLAPELRAAYPVWLAEYDAEVPTAPLDFSIWQYTNAGTVPGIPTDVDLNVWLEPQK